jgi:hypothetical protein
MVKIYLAFLVGSLALINCGSCSTVPVNILSATRSEEVRLSGQTIATLTNQDLAHPALSPDGKVLAYSEVLVENGVENTTVQLYDLQSGQVTNLLDAEKAREYKTYKVYVSRMTWQQPDRLEVMVNDGDVDSTRLIFNPQTGELVEQEAIEPGVLSDEEQEKHRQILALFPELTEADLGRWSSNFIPTEGGIIWGGELANRGRNVWFLDFKNRSMNPLFPADDSRTDATLGSGVNVGGATIFPLMRESASFLFSYKNGVIQQLERIDSGNVGVKAVYQSPTRGILMLQLHASYEQGNNPLFVFENDQLTRVQEYAELYDVAVDAQGTRIAYCYWLDGKRRIEVKALR